MTQPPFEWHEPAAETPPETGGPGGPDELVAEPISDPGAESSAPADGEAGPDLVAEPVDGAEEAAPEGDVTVELMRELDERTSDLQRLQAEYVNYKRRVDRDRQVVRNTATATVLTGLLSVLDDVDRAREHGELTGGFKAVADSLERTLAGLGLQRFGEVGEPFDPRVHEALMHEHAEDVDGPTARAILQPGYAVGERVLRPARVTVAEPPPPGAAAAEQDMPAAGDDDCAR